MVSEGPEPTGWWPDGEELDAAERAFMQAVWHQRVAPVADWLSSAAEKAGHTLDGLAHADRAALVEELAARSVRKGARMPMPTAIGNPERVWAYAGPGLNRPVDHVTLYAQMVLSGAYVASTSSSIDGPAHWIAPALEHFEPRGSELLYDLRADDVCERIEDLEVRLGELLCGYANELWPQRRHVCLADIVVEDLLAIDDRVANKPRWMADLVGACKPAVDDFLDEMSKVGDDMPTMPDYRSYNPAYLAALGAAEICAVFPTVQPPTAFRWVASGAREGVPDMRIVPTSRMTVEVLFRRNLAGSKGRRGGSDGVLSALMASLSDRTERVLSVERSHNSPRHAPDWQRDPLPLRDQAFLLSEHIVDEMMHKLVPEDVLRSGKPHRRRALQGRPREYRPRPPEGWRGCLTACLFLALCERIGIDRQKYDTLEFRNPKSVDYWIPDWTVLSDWLGDWHKIIRRRDSRRDGSDEFVEVAPHNYYRKR